MFNTLTEQLKPGSYTWLYSPEMGSKPHMWLALDSDPEKGLLMMPLSSSTTWAANKPWHMAKSPSYNTYNAWDKAKWWKAEEMQSALATEYAPTALKSAEWDAMQDSLMWELHWAKKSTADAAKLKAAALLQAQGY